MDSLSIAQAAKMQPIGKIAEKAGIPAEFLEPYGKFKAKVELELLEKLKEKKNGKLVLVTAITPTKAGEGKTTTTIGLAQGLAKHGEKAMICLREPSLGPVFGIKGGATGGGYSQVLPMDEIDLHFTGDLHAVSAANNLLSAMIDNHLFQGNALNLDPERISFKRVVDMNDRALRNIKIGLKGQGIEREESFMITVASEVMAILCLAENLSDLKERLGKIIVGLDKNGKPVTAKQLKANGAMALLLKDALKPNLVQSIEGVPAFVHGGPFANIAHGCNSVVATKTALKLADIVITEAGFGADLGAEKFLDIKCRKAKLAPNAIVLVATIRALRMHGGAENYSEKNLAAVEKGLPNLGRHIGNLRQYGVPLVVAINLFSGSDSEEEVEAVKKFCASKGVKGIPADVFGKGGEGAKELAAAVVAAAKEKNEFKLIYSDSQPVREKIEAIAKKIYHAKSVSFTETAEKNLAEIEANGFNHLPVCMAKTQYSFSDNPKLLNAPDGFTLTITALRVSAGAGFVVALCGDIMTMPGLGKIPAAEKIDIDEKGKISGLF
ncbi:MAG: formate--tetrahydrofolate ligase [Candidatus Diapherotrites archaeon]